MPLNRREMLQTSAGAAAYLSMGLPSAQANTASGRRPNIILIMADDMGYSDLGCYGAEIRTPNIDSMAAGGLRFTQFYNAARCCPTRASLLTGLYPHQAGVGSMVRDNGFPGYRGRLNERCVTIAEALSRGGYRTLMSGKWHVGEERPHWPCDRGFDEYYGLISGASSFWELDEGRNFAHNNTPIDRLPPDHYMTDAFSDHAIRMIETHSEADDPFFLYLPYTAPHWPLHAHQEDIERYRGQYGMGWDALREERFVRMKEKGVIDADTELPPGDPNNPAWEDAEHKDWQDARMATYAAQIDSMDQGIGRILDAVRRRGLEENTLVLFLIDNGGCHEGRSGNDPNIMPGPRDTYQSYGRAWAEASNTPFRKYKHWVHEGGISTPLVAYWPGVIEAGGITPQTGHIIDILPTCLDLAGVEYPEEHQGHAIQPTEGLSLAPIFEGQEREGHEALYWEHHGNCAIRQGDWKLVKARGGEWELFDLAEDRPEQNNLAQDRPDLHREMRLMYESWANRVGVLPWDFIRRHRADS